MPKKERDIRIVGKRRAFDVGRFVLAIVAHAEALSEAEAEATAAGQIDDPAEDASDRVSSRGNGRSRPGSTSAQPGGAR